MDETEAAGAVPPPSRDYAVVIGINLYGDPQFATLKGPIADAEDFIGWLTDEAGGQVPPDHVFKLLLNPDPPPADAATAVPTETQVDQQFELLLQRMQQAGISPGRRLYIYLSGHGLVPGLEAAWSNAVLLTANASLPLGLGHHVPGPGYAEWFLGAGWFEEVVLFMDCCRDAGPNQPPRPVPFGLPLRPSKHGAGLYVALACGYGCQAREQPGPDGGRVRGIFTEVLLQCLRGPGRDGALTGDTLYDHLHTALGATEQEPQIRREGRRLEFRPAAAAPPVTFRRAPETPRGVWVVVLDGLTLSSKATFVLEDEYQVPLAAGLYTILAGGNCQRKPRTIELRATGDEDVTI